MNKTLETLTLRTALKTDNFLDKRAKRSLLAIHVLNAIVFICVVFVYVLGVRERIDFTQAYIFSFLLGVFLSFFCKYGTQIKQALILRKYISWDKEAIQRRLDEINP